MHAIHCFSSKPMQMGRSISGDEDINKKIFYPDYMLATLCLSALQWRKTNGTITLHTDSNFYQVLEKKGFIGFWDSVERTLDNISEKMPRIDHAVFWSAAKFYCYSLHKAPFACIDTDIIVWNKLNLNPKHSLIFTHWESIEQGDKNYPGRPKIIVDPSYDFNECENVIKKGINMSVTIFLNEKFKNMFTDEAVKFMLKSGRKFDGSYATPEILYMEQVLPVELATKYRFSISPLIQCIWSPKQFKFTMQDKKRDWIFNKFDQDQVCTHLWFHKNYIEKNEEARKEYMNELIHVFKKDFPVEYTIFEKTIST
ncbi:MAG: hypothetical protein N2749_00370 [Clostridia bacterium]|nr:hypothetical protein [Clostridia bacterium]